MVRDLRVCAVLLPGKDFHFHFHQAKINFPFHVCRTWVNMGQQMNCLQGRDTCFQIWKVISISKEGVFLIGHNCWSLLDPAIHLGLLGLNHCSALMLREVVKKDQNTIKNAKHAKFAEFAENAKYTNVQNGQNMQNLQNVQIVQNVQYIRRMQSMQNIQNMHNIQNMKNMQNMQNRSKQSTPGFVVPLAMF